MNQLGDKLAASVRSAKTVKTSTDAPQPASSVPPKLVAASKAEKFERLERVLPELPSKRVWPD